MHRQTGFSLIEALVSLLVLSIGWLGLGQLQVRLSIASLNQSNTAYARLVQSVIYEKTVSYEVSGILDNLPDSTPVSTPSSTYNIQLSQSLTDTLSDTTIEVAWTDTDMARNEIFTATLSTYPSPYDSRWLLIAP